MSLLPYLLTGRALESTVLCSARQTLDVDAKGGPVFWTQVLGFLSLRSNNDSSSDDTDL
jgi:hypothetical protein